MCVSGFTSILIYTHTAYVRACMCACVRACEYVRARVRAGESVSARVLCFSVFPFRFAETSDSFVNHFDGHFAYLKTLDFYFNWANC